MALWSCFEAGQAYSCMSQKGLLLLGFLRGFDFKGKIAMQEPRFEINILENMHFWRVWIGRIKLPCVSIKCNF